MNSTTNEAATDKKDAPPKTAETVSKPMLDPVLNPATEKPNA